MRSIILFSLVCRHVIYFVRIYRRRYPTVRWTNMSTYYRIPMWTSLRIFGSRWRSKSLRWVLTRLLPGFIIIWNGCMISRSRGIINGWITWLIIRIIGRLRHISPVGKTGSVWERVRPMVWSLWRKRQMGRQPDGSGIRSLGRIGGFRMVPWIRGVISRFASTTGIRWMWSFLVSYPGRWS